MASRERERERERERRKRNGWKKEINGKEKGIRWENEERKMKKMTGKKQQKPMSDTWSSTGLYLILVSILVSIYYKFIFF